MAEVEPNDPLVRVVGAAIDQLDMSPLLAQYKGGGTSSYHPQMLLKVLVYAYCSKSYSSRRIAAALRENIHFMCRRFLCLPTGMLTVRTDEASIAWLCDSEFVSPFEEC